MRTISGGTTAESLAQGHRCQKHRPGFLSLLLAPNVGPVSTSAWTGVPSQGSALLAISLTVLSLPLAMCSGLDQWLIPPLFVWIPSIFLQCSWSVVFSTLASLLLKTASARLRTPYWTPGIDLGQTLMTMVFFSSFAFSSFLRAFHFLFSSTPIVPARHLWVLSWRECTFVEWSASLSFRF